MLTVRDDRMFACSPVETFCALMLELFWCEQLIQVSSHTHIFRKTSKPFADPSGQHFMVQAS
jgi:hypothetical protein